MPHQIVATLKDLTRENLELKVHDLESIQLATFNILEDFSLEREKLASTERAIFNILDDFSQERARIEDVQLATFNILEDSALEKDDLEKTKRATFNILEDFVTQRDNLEDLQVAVFNILDDLSSEKSKLTNEVLDRKRAEKDLETANAELESFSYSVSHDLRAPLRGIDGFSHALLADYGDKLDDVGREYLNFVRTSSQQMAQLIDDLLNLSRLSRGAVYHETFNLSDMAKSIIATLHSDEPKRNVKFNVPDQVSAGGDPRLIRVVLENLLGNAWKFTAKKKQSKIDLNFKLEEGKTIYFISDNGAGFDMAFADKLFGAFQRLHTSAEFPGTGIGLATVRRIIHRHGGKIWVESKIGIGTTFYFTLSS